MIREYSFGCFNAVGYHCLYGKMKGTQGNPMRHTNILLYVPIQVGA